MEIIIKKKTKREIAVGYFRLTQPSIGKRKDVWIFDDRSGASIAIKELDFESILRRLHKINLLNKGDIENGANISERFIEA